MDNDKGHGPGQPRGLMGHFHQTPRNDGQYGKRTLSPNTKGLGTIKDWDFQRTQGLFFSSFSKTFRKKNENEK